MSRVTLCVGRTSPSVATLDDVSSESEMPSHWLRREPSSRGPRRSYVTPPSERGTVLRSRIGDIGPIDDQEWYSLVRVVTRRTT